MSGVVPGGPAFAVVLASCRDSALAAAALHALKPQCAAAGAPLIVARAAAADSPELTALLEGCTVVRCPPGASIPAIRGAGLAAANAEWVALTEDNCVADAGWLAALRRAARPGIAVLGGVMGNAQMARALDWGAFFAEYGFFGAARPEPGPGQALLVTGANVAYHHAVLADVAAWAQAGIWENEIHARLAARGSRLALAPDAIVRQNLTYRLAPFCRDRYEHGRDYARVRAGQTSLPQRAVLAAGAAALPPLLAWRVWNSAGRESPAAFARALPATLTFLAAWAWGELVGYLTGPRDR
jgi:hypothetical protein